MKIIEPSVQMVTPIVGREGDILRRIEETGRTCYKSEDKITTDSAADFVKRIIASGHHSVLEHASLSVRFIVDRGISHEIVRHRIASYSQESTRYCNYSKEKFGEEITVVRPCYFKTDGGDYVVWKTSCLVAEQAYFGLLKRGCKPEEARAVLPMSLKTELVMTANIREWRHFLTQRTAKACHPQMRQIAGMLLDILAFSLPALFGDLKFGELKQFDAEEAYIQEKMEKQDEVWLDKIKQEAEDGVR